MVHVMIVGSTSIVADAGPAIPPTFGRRLTYLASFEIIEINDLTEQLDGWKPACSQFG